MGADAHDIGLSIHPHPTLSESVAMASEIKEIFSNVEMWKGVIN